MTRALDPLSIFLCQRALEVLSFRGEVGVDRFVKTPLREHAGDLETVFHAKQDSHAPGRDEPADILTNRGPERFKAILAGEREYPFIERSQGKATDGNLKTAGLFRRSRWLIHAHVSSRPAKCNSAQALRKLAN